MKSDLESGNGLGTVRARDIHANRGLPMPLARAAIALALLASCATGVAAGDGEKPATAVAKAQEFAHGAVTVGRLEAAARTKWLPQGDVPLVPGDERSPAEQLAQRGKVELLPNWDPSRTAVRLLPNWDLSEHAVRLLPNYDKGTMALEMLAETPAVLPRSTTINASPAR